MKEALISALQKDVARNMKMKFSWTSSANDEEYKFGTGDFSVDCHISIVPKHPKEVDELVCKKLSVCKKCKYFSCMSTAAHCLLFKNRKDWKIYYCKLGEQADYKKPFLEMKVPMICPCKIEHLVL